MERKTEKFLSDDERYFRIRSLVASAGSHIFHVTFIKKDGKLREMQVQQAAIKNHVRGAERSESADKSVATRAFLNPNLLNVFDIQAAKLDPEHAIRSINMDTVTRMKVDGIEYEFVP